MRSLRITGTRISSRMFAEISDSLRAGGVVAFPTDTAYGLAADPWNATAVKKIFSIKGRAVRKPLPLIAASMAEVEKRFMVRGAARHLASHYWPGPLTLVLPFKRGERPSSFGATGAVRVAASAIARAVAAAFGGIVTSTSANLSGESPIYDPAEIRRTFRDRARQPDIFLDAGKLPPRKPSTIAVVRRGKIEILREGSVNARVVRLWGPRKGAARAKARRALAG